MLLSLFLQHTITTSSLTGVYLALGGTIVASILALVASIRASNKSANTAYQLANLTTQAPEALKDKDYKRDYYRKVIDKRMKAIEEIEEILGQFTTYEHITITDKDGKVTEGKLHRYYRDNADALLIGNINILKNDQSVFGTWCNNSTGKAIAEFINLIVDTVKDVNEVEKDPTKRLVSFSFRYNEIKEKLSEVESFIGQEMATLYDIEAFFKRKYPSK
jgi:hypothetical protein